MKKIFYSKKPDRIFLALYGALVLFLLCITSIVVIDTQDYLALLALLPILVLLIPNVFASRRILRIKLTSQFLEVHYIFRVYRVPLPTITKIRWGETMWSGFHKYGTATRGLIVFARGKNDLYITPQNPEEFIHLLQSLNPEITLETVN